MLYLKGRINSVKLVKPENGKKPFYNVQLVSETEKGTLILTNCKLYPNKADKEGKAPVAGEDVEIQVKVNAWDKNKFQLIGFM